MSGLVGSTPSLTRNGRPSASFWRSSASLMICALPCLRRERVSSGCMWENAETGALFVLVQQFSHLLDRERRIAVAQRLLALASSEKWAITGERSHRQITAAFRSNARAVGGGRNIDGVGFHQLRPG